MLLDELETVLKSRVDADPEQSYTARLLNDSELTQRKIMEEAFEVCLELARARPDAVGGPDRSRVAEEAADVIYHLLVGLVGASVSLDEVMAVLAERRQ